MCRCSAVCLSLSVEHNREPYKNGRTDRDVVWVVDSGRTKETLVGARIPRGRGHFFGGGLFLIEMYCESSKRPQQHGAADLTAGAAVTAKKCGFRMDSFARRGGDKCGAMHSFVRILPPVVVVRLVSRWSAVVCCIQTEAVPRLSLRPSSTWRKRRRRNCGRSCRNATGRTWTASHSSCRRQTAVRMMPRKEPTASASVVLYFCVLAQFVERTDHIFSYSLKLLTLLRFLYTVCFVSLTLLA